MSSVFISGIGAVSPAGWGVDSMSQAVERNIPIQSVSISSPVPNSKIQVRPVPACKVRPVYLSHPRLRRSSPVSQYAAAAAVEAFGTQSAEAKIGIIFSFQSGCVQYADRFYGETLREPETASPLLFPETVLAAPTSHTACVFKNVPITETLVGDPGTFLQGMAMGANLLFSGQVDKCIVIGAEESSWLVSSAFQLWNQSAIGACGAGAVCLSLNPRDSIGVELKAITDSFAYSTIIPRNKAAASMRAELPSSGDNVLLCDGVQNLGMTDMAEKQVWSDWQGPRISPKLILGDGLCAAAAWQCVLAIQRLRQKRESAAIVSVVGCNQQAIGAYFTQT